MARDGTAVIRTSDRVGHERDSGEPWPWEIGLNRFGHNKYDLTLEVRVPGEQPYTITDRFKVPRKAENLGLFDAARKIPAGVEVPVTVDGRGRVEIDWDAWIASPGRKDAMRAGRATASADAYRKQLERNPKLLAQVQASNKQAAQSWAEATKLGHLTREQFEQQLTTEVEHGRMHPADAEAARARLDG